MSNREIELSIRDSLKEIREANAAILRVLDCQRPSDLLIGGENYFGQSPKNVVSIATRNSFR